MSRRDWGLAVVLSLAMHAAILVVSGRWVVPDAAVPLDIPVEMEWAATKVQPGVTIPRDSTETTGPVGLPKSPSDADKPVTTDLATAPGKEPTGSRTDQPVVQKPPVSSAAGPLGGDWGDALALIPPVLREKPPLVYPEEAKRAGTTGTVVLTAEVREDGGLERIAVYRSSGSAVLDAAARSHVIQWRFTPARQATTNKPVRVVTQIRIHFGAEGG